MNSQNRMEMKGIEAVNLKIDQYNLPILNIWERKQIETKLNSLRDLRGHNKIANIHHWRAWRRGKSGA